MAPTQGIILQEATYNEPQYGLWEGEGKEIYQLISSWIKVHLFTHRCQVGFCVVSQNSVSGGKQQGHEAKHYQGLVHEIRWKEACRARYHSSAGTRWLKLRP